MDGKTVGTKVFRRKVIKKQNFNKIAFRVIAVFVTPPIVVLVAAKCRKLIDSCNCTHTEKNCHLLSRSIFA